MCSLFEAAMKPFADQPRRAVLISSYQGRGDHLRVDGHERGVLLIGQGKAAPAEARVRGLLTHGGLACL